MSELKQSLDNVIELVKCSMNKCKKETEEFNKFKDDSYRKLGILFQKHSNGFITNNTYKKETNKIINEIHNRKETIDYIKCRVNNCNENLKNNLIYNINNALKIRKDKKSKIILNHYLKLFQEKEINHQDIIKYYTDIKMIAS
jgi:uncharacterized protein YeeX (DUF496 family)